MKKHLPIIAALLIVLTGFTRDNRLGKLLAQLAHLTASYPQEKVHLQTDKPYYAIGEDIWFKAYTVTAEKNEPSQLSAVLYVDLINEQDEVKKQVSVALKDGAGWGNISLIDLAGGGKYRLRAYTNYMRNYDAGFFFEKIITVGNVLDKPSDKKEKEGSSRLSLQFFPEGGSMVAGIRGKVGVKAVTGDGFGANLKGYIINRNKDKVAIFATGHAGIGAFAFTPLPGDKYTAVVTLANGDASAFELPEVAATGYVLSVNKVEEHIKVQISASQVLVKGEELSVIAQSNGVACSYFKFKADKPGFAVNIPVKEFPTGIVQFTLFNAANEPLAERLVFVNRHDALNIEAESPLNAAVKGKTNLNIKVSDVTGAAVDGHFSVSVTDAGKVPYQEDDETTILSSLLLTSDLKGYIEQPNYYFNNTDEEKERQLDNLLLTQGWRRFVWKDVAAGLEPDIKFRPELSLEITGKVSSLAGKPVAGAKVILASTTPNIFFNIDTVTDALGNFVFDRLDISDSTTFIVQAKGAKDTKDVMVKINERPGVEERDYKGISVNIAPYLETTKAMFVELDKFHMLHDGVNIKEVKVTAAKPFTRESVLNVKNSANVSGSADFVMKKEELEKHLTFASVMLKVPNVTEKDKLYYSTRKMPSITHKPQPMLMILDGTPLPFVSDDLLSSLNPKDIEGIEVLTSGYYRTVYGEAGLGGVIYITTKKTSSLTNKATNVARSGGHGYTMVREFYAPDYDDPKINKDMQDLRSTIYWKPNLVTDRYGKATLSYFNAGTPGTYQVTIEGMDAFGNIGRKVFIYEVSQGL